MNLILTGKILSIITLFVFKKLVVLKYFELKIYESIIGWFFVEYVYEAYSATPGSLFFTLGDFRSLIINFVLVFKEIVFNKTLVLFFKYFIIILSFVIVCYILALKNMSFPLKLLFSFYFNVTHKPLSTTYFNSMI